LFSVCFSVVEVVFVGRWNFIFIHVQAWEFGRILPLTSIIIGVSGIALLVRSCYLV
jgi:hypothetical protein